MKRRGMPAEKRVLRVLWRSRSIAIRDPAAENGRLEQKRVRSGIRLCPLFAFLLSAANNAKVSVLATMRYI